MNELLNLAITNKMFNSVIDKIKEKKGPINLLGLNSVAKTYLVSSIKKVNSNPICIVTYNEIQGRKLVLDLEKFTDGVYFFPKKEIVTYDYLAESKEIAYSRMKVLNAIKEGKAKVIVTTIEAIMQPMISKDVLNKNILEFKLQGNYSIEEIKSILSNLGYERSDLVEAKGQFSVRGDILDIGIEDSKGVRIEFWGEDVDSIRYFSYASQRSTEETKKAIIYPSTEYVIEKDLNDVCQDILNAEVNLKFEQKLEQEIEEIKEGNYSSKIDRFISYFYNSLSNFIEYMPKETIFFLDEKQKIEQRVESIKKDNRLIIKNLIDNEKVVPDILTQIKEVKLPKECIYLESSDSKIKENNYDFNVREINYNKIIFFEEIENIFKNKNYVIVMGGTEDTCKKIEEVLIEKEIPCIYQKKLIELEKNKIIIIPGDISSGFEIKELEITLINGSNIFKQENKRRKKLSSVFKQGEQVVFSDLKIGDFVVHKTNGIGQFIGVNTIKADGVTKDYIKIKYLDNGILYIPTNALDNIRKYIGAGEGEPKLNKLGSKDWVNTKARVKKNLREVARNLIELYATRQKVNGYAFSKDTPWQKQFEDSFPYVETEDQLRCIEEVKKDMELAKPMDRLLCGDVGYGKTEVAIRAAFKACMDQKQVAYLVPTTVLANQQYESFKERMEQFAIKVELLNRFRTAKEQKEVIKKLKFGEVDVVIGTHRLLSKDVEYKDLGLLIIDEEHRFGVKDKEKIKELKTSIDVLTMTATPIPRTLHMSIVGVRDMSVIYEPPQNRKPVQTYVLSYDEEVVKEAITKELERNGQVFYLYNKVDSIARKAEEIASLVPEARIGYAHGRMTGRELENIMMDFVNHDIDVLVCTTILESGIDIPNANTIIVENADRLGLAQLYQVRGRVGRSDIQSYAYITYKPNKLLSEVADKRLKAMREFTEFGSGFKIAMRDLEIRGAGSLIGEIQHGHMEQVGYDTYCKLLDEVVKEMQGIKVEEEQDIQIDINVSSYLSDEYIENSSQKIEVYQNIALCKTEEDIQNIIDEIIDRYGTMPEEAENLIEIARIKNMCRKDNIIKIQQKQDKVLFYFTKDGLDEEVISNLIKKYSNNIKFSQGLQNYITFNLKNNNVIKEIKEFIKNCQKN